MSPSNHSPEADSPQLDAFLRADVWIQVPPGRATRDWIKAVYADAHPAPPALLDEHLPHRIMAMWRIVRATAVIKGLCAEDELLDGSTDTQPSPWTHPFLPILTPLHGAALRRERAIKLLTYHAEGKGLSLLPPRRDEMALERWCSAAALIASDLGIETTDAGRLGLQGLLDPALAVACDVSSGHVIAFEDLIVTECMNILLDLGERACIKHFREEYGFSRKECIGLIRVAKVSALERSAAGIEEKRAMQELRYEDIIGRAKEALDTDTELKAMKELARIQGLTRTEPENMGMEFLSVVKLVAQRQDAEIMSQEDIQLLDAPRAEEVEPITIEAEVVDPDDAAAVAEYDRENQHK